MVLNYVDWYLVELNRHLEGKLDPDRLESLLVEIRAHLEEKILELTQQGASLRSAERAAVREFGDPHVIAASALGGTGLTAKMVRRGVLLAASLGSMLSLAFLLAIIESPRVHQTTLISWLLWGSALALPLIGYLAMRSRQWVAVPAAALALAFTLVLSVFMAFTTRPFRIGGEVGHIFTPTLGRELADIDGWLAAYETDTAKMRQWQQTNDQSLLDQLMGHEPWYAPTSSAGRRTLPSHPRSGSYNPVRDEVNLALAPFETQAEARLVWVYNLEMYLRFLEVQRDHVVVERRALSNLLPSTPWSQWQAVGGAFMLIIGCGSLLALLINGLILAVFGVQSSLRRRQWMRQLA